MMTLCDSDRKVTRLTASLPLCRASAGHTPTTLGHLRSESLQLSLFTNEVPNKAKHAKPESKKQKWHWTKQRIVSAKYLLEVLWYGIVTSAASTTALPKASAFLCSKQRASDQALRILPSITSIIFQLFRRKKCTIPNSKYIPC